MIDQQIRNKIVIGFSFLISLVFFGSFVYFSLLTSIRKVYPLCVTLFSVVCLGLGGLFTFLGFKVILSLSARSNISRKIILAAGLMLMIAFPIAEYSLVSFGGYFHVDQIYLWNDGPYITFGEDPQTEMVISWLTCTITPTEILFGTSPESLEKIRSNAPRSHLHHFYLSNLTPNTKYYYKINRNFYSKHETDLFSFTTAPNDNRDFEMIIVGDMQPTWLDTIRSGALVAEGIAKENPDFVIQLGDLSSSGEMALIWHFTMKNFPLYAANAPFQVAVGNHDYSGGGDVNTRMLFPYPYASSDGLYYSFDYANCHFVIIDNFDAGNYKMTSAQKIWVEQDIIEAKSRGQKWIFVNFHHTILTTGTSGHNWDLQTWLVPLADKYDVDGIFFGHDHHYEHWNYTYGSSGLLYNKTDIPSGNETHYWCSGGGGAHLEVDYGILTHDPWNVQRTFYNISAGEYQNYSFTRNPWNSSLYVNSDAHKIYAESKHHELYYHLPETQSYSTDNELYGYQYGEQTLHYMKLTISNNGNTCTISAHYPNGDLLTGPYGLYPQIWPFNK
ncbi:MAG: metallophosphoesterase family protein [Candidatus Lokiarchaeota archaeon]|nr:metallophosphoesterase family protein [Candidatus Lokiarchaeota archaeon]